MEEECILKGDGEMGGAYIVRLPAGDSDVYLRRGGGNNGRQHLRRLYALHVHDGHGLSRRLDIDSA